MLVYKRFVGHVGGQIRQNTPGAWGGLHTGSTAQNPKVGASPELKIHQKSIKNIKKQKWSRNGQRNELSTSRYHRSARNFATILMVATVLRITKVPKILEKKLCAAIGTPELEKT